MLLEALLAHESQALALNSEALTAGRPRPLCLGGQGPCRQICIQAPSVLSRVVFLFTPLMEDSHMDTREAALCATDPHRTSSVQPQIRSDQSPSRVRLFATP